LVVCICSRVVGTLLIDEDNQTQYTTIQDKDSLDQILLQKNIDHFKHAQETPFAQQSMIDLIGTDGCSHEAIKIIESQVPKNIPKYPKLYLAMLSKARET
jgi:hypothetical protein